MGGGHPKLGKNSTNSDLSQIFSVILDQLKIVIGGKKIASSPQPKLNFRQNRVGEAPQIRQKFNQLGFGSNFQGNLRPIKDLD